MENGRGKMEEDIINRIICEFEKSHQIKTTAQNVGCSWNRVVKVLSSNGISINDLQTEIMDMHKDGLTLEEIAEKTGKNIKTVQAYLPASRPFYKVESPDRYRPPKISQPINKKSRPKIDYHKYKDTDMSILSPREREALTAVINRGNLSITAAGNEIGISSNSIGKLLNRAVAKLDGRKLPKKREATERKEPKIKRRKPANTKICEICGKEFKCRPSVTRYTCSFECRSKRAALKQAEIPRRLERQVRVNPLKKSVPRTSERIDYSAYKDADLSSLSASEKSVLIAKAESPSASIKDIAAQLGLNPGTAQNKLSRARAKADGRYSEEEEKAKRREYMKRNADKIRGARKAYYEAHWEERLEYSKKYNQHYYKDHKDEYKVRSAAYYQAHREEIKEKVRERYIKNKEEKGIDENQKD